MHIPDGLFDPGTIGGAGTILGTAAISAGALGYGLYRVRRDLSDRATPLMGVTAACLFAAQMLNFPIPLGTSGHLLGGVLAAVMLGPWGGMVVLTAVLLVQCFLFQDGGLTVLGANVFNLGLIGCGVGYCIFASVRRRIHGPAGTLAASAIASWFSVVLGAVACSIELWLAAGYPLGPAIGAMVLAHSIIGLGEALVTGLALSFVLRTRPDLIYGQVSELGLAGRSAQVMLAGGAVALVLAVLLSPFASELPDGLEWSLAKLGFDQEAASAVLAAPFPNYHVPGMENLEIAGSVAGAIGVLAAFGVAYGLARSVRSKLPVGHVPDAS